MGRHMGRLTNTKKVKFYEFPEAGIKLLTEIDLRRLQNIKGGQINLSPEKYFGAHTTCTAKIIGIYQTCP